MHHKNIKLTIRKQLKKHFPNWKRIPKKTKKVIADEVLMEATSEYDFNQEIDAPVEELLAIETQMPAKGIIKLDEDDGIINHLLAYAGYSPSMRGVFPHNLFRAELLKAIKYPEISYRNFVLKNI